ncbi:MAG: DnaD domain protein [Anaerolineales bacterium]|nr:DnaD domain protein [Anaerolineales bacterium]MCZ2121776.1 DnaD domain protein [Anaerolineales bacterium]
MNKFNGFTSSETFTQVPDAFFRLLKEITDAEEIKVALYALWQIERMEGNFRALAENNFEAEALGLNVKEIRRGLKKCVERGILLRAEKDAQVLYFLNSPRGRLAADAYLKVQAPQFASAVTLEKSNIFKLYEENIGALTPLIADTLKDAEQIYASEWIADAIGLAVKNNKRNWKYIEAILKRWKEDGRGEKQDRRNDKKDSQPSLNRKIEQLRKRSGA